MNITEEEYKKMIENTLIANKALEKILNINITDEDLKKYYENNKNQFKIPKALKLRQIYLNTEQEANDVYLALEAGADFKKLAALKSADPVLKEKEGDIGFISKGMLLPELEKEIFLLEVGKYTKPLKTGNGYSIIKVEEIREEKELSFEEIKDKLREVLKSNIISANRRNVIENLKSQAKIEIK
jgi:parvulin-like peptidyl-prolyl isomerase